MRNSHFRKGSLARGVLVAACIALPVALTSAQAPAPYGMLRGMARDAGGRAVADAYVTVHSVDHNSDRNVVTASDGSFALLDLAPGGYTVTVARLQYNSPQPATVRIADAATQTLNLTLPAQPLRPRTWREKMLHNPAHS